MNCTKQDKFEYWKRCVMYKNGPFKLSIKIIDTGVTFTFNLFIKRLSKNLT